MHALDLPRTYQTIYICDSFGIGGDRTQDLETLRRCHGHLTPGGTLIFSHDLPYRVSPQTWSYWLPDGRRNLPEPWPDTGSHRRAANGDDYELRSHLAAFDPLNQHLTLQIRATLHRAGQLIAEEEHTLTTNLYFRNELLLMLELTGFTDVTIRAGYTDNAPTADDTMLVFIARK
jgi:hypothetical protein